MLRLVWVVLLNKLPVKCEIQLFLLGPEIFRKISVLQWQIWGGGEGGIGQYPSYQNTSCPTSIDEDQPKNEIKVVRHYDGSQLKNINGYTQ